MKSTFGLVPLQWLHLSCGEAPSRAPSCFHLHPFLCFFLWFIALHNCFFFLSQTKFTSTQLSLTTHRTQLAPHKNPANHFFFLLFSQGWAFTCRAEGDVGYFMSPAVRGEAPALFLCLSPVWVLEGERGTGTAGSRPKSPWQMAAPGSSSEFNNLLNNCDL